MNQYVSSLRLRVAFVLSIDLAILGMVEDDLGVRSVLTGYGMTETSTVVTRNRWDDPREVRFTTQGKPLPGLEIMIADPESGAPLPAETAGEVLVRGYAVTPGYYRKDAEFAKVMRSDGWFRTGDKAVLTAEGRISFQSRLGDDYKSRGFNVSPSEIEAVMATHPKVHAVAVVGVPDTEHGTVGVAFVIPRQGQHCDESEMLEFLRPKLANFKIPRHVLSVSEFPLTEATGKVQKFKLPARGGALFLRAMPSLRIATTIRMPPTACTGTGGAFRLPVGPLRRCYDGHPRVQLPRIVTAQAIDTII